MSSGSGSAASLLPFDALVLETERLILRPLSLGDLQLALALFTNPAVVEYVCDVKTPEEIEAGLKIEVRRGAGGRLGVWKIIHRQSGQAIGSCVLLPLPVETTDTEWSTLAMDRYPDAEIEVGYLLLPDFWGNGYATETCKRLLRFAFENTELNEVKATTDFHNSASQHVLRKSGLRDEGMRRAYATQCNGFGISRADWLATTQ